MSRQGEFPWCKGSSHAMEGALQRRAKQGFCAQPILSTCHKTLDSRAKPELLQAPLHRKTEEPRRTPLGEHVKTERISVMQRGRTMPWKVLCRGVPRSSLPLQEYTCRGPLRCSKSIPAEVLSAAQVVYLQRSCLPTRDDACRCPLCCPKGIPAEVLSAHPR